MFGMRIGVDVGIAVTAGGVTAVTRPDRGEASAVLVDGWPTQSLDTRDEQALDAAIQRLHDTVWSDIDRVVVTYPGTFGTARANRIRQAVEKTGWTETRLVSTPASVALEHTDTYHPGITVVADVTADRCQAAVLTPQPGTSVGYVASRVAEHNDQGLIATINTATAAAEVNATDVTRVVVIATPPGEQAAAETLAAAGQPGTEALSPVQVAENGLRADDLITDGHRNHPAERNRGAWPRPVSTLACAVASLVLLVAVGLSAGSIGAQPDASTFALGCLGLVTAIQGAASYWAAKIATTRTGSGAWASAGRCLLIGSATGAAAVIAAVVTVAAIFGVSPWPVALAGGLAVVVTLAATATIAVGIAWHPDQPPHRNLWPPVGAMTAVCAAALLIHNTYADTTTGAGLEALPMRFGIGVWMFAITGLVVAAPWPRVLTGLLLGVAAGFIVTAATLPVFAIIVVAVVSGWWLVTASLVSYDRHGLPALKPPHLSSNTRTVY